MTLKREVERKELESHFDGLNYAPLLDGRQRNEELAKRTRVRL
jgi:hypothetical protein